MIHAMEGIWDMNASMADRAAPEGSVSPAAGFARRADPVVERAEELVAWLAMTDGAGVDDAVRIDRIAALERAKGALAAAQVRQTVAFAASQRAALPTWTPPAAAARSIGSQVALARRESPTRGDAHVALAQALSRSMPRTLAALTTGEISEDAAEGIHRALDGMDAELVRVADDRLSPELGRRAENSLAEAARRVADAIDDDAASRRVERAALSRRLTLRMAKDGMAYLTLLAPVAEAAGAFQAVDAEAVSLLGGYSRPDGASRCSAFWLADGSDPSAPSRPGQASVDPARASNGAVVGAPLMTGSVGRGTTRSQLTADLVVSRLTGRAIGQPVPIEIQLVMTDQALGEQDLHRSAEPAASGAAKHGQSLSPQSIGPESIRHESTGQGSARLRVMRPQSVVPESTSPAKVVGAGWLPAGFARELVQRTAAAGSDVIVRRVVTDPDGATVIGLEARRRRLEAPKKHPQTVPSINESVAVGHSRTVPRVDPTADPSVAVGRPRSLLPTLLAPTHSTQRLFRGILRRLVVVRDQECRTPFCAAPIRAADHVSPARRDGPTSAHNAEGKCDRCNLTKEAPGWEVIVLSPGPGGSRDQRSDPSVPSWQRVMDALLADEEDQSVAVDSGHQTAVVTPTGHVYRSAAPAVTERGWPAMSTGRLPL